MDLCGKSVVDMEMEMETVMETAMTVVTVMERVYE